MARPVSDRITVPERWPCDFRYAGVPPVVEAYRVCGRTLGVWLSCPSVQAATDGGLWDDL